MMLSAKQALAVIDSADAAAVGAAVSMVAADPVLLRESQGVLGDLVERLSGIRDAVKTSGHSWPSNIRERLSLFCVQLGRLQRLSDAAMSSIVLRNQGSTLATGSYTVRGAETARLELTTVVLEG